MNVRGALRYLTLVGIIAAVGCGGASDVPPPDGGGTSSGSSSGTGSSSGGGGTAGSGASSSGSATSGGEPSDAATDAASSGSGASDASVDAPAMCFGDGGKLVRDGKVCYATDSECTVLHVYTCCGTDVAVGLANNRAQYAACYPQAIRPGACGQLGCAKSPNTVTEDGDSTANGGTPVARCVIGPGGGQCMTQIPPPPPPPDPRGGPRPSVAPPPAPHNPPPP